MVRANQYRPNSDGHEEALHDVELSSSSRRGHRTNITTGSTALSSNEETVGLLQTLRDRSSTVPSSPGPLVKSADAIVGFLRIETVIWLSLLLMNIMAWYFTNGMNGISMQSYAASLRERSIDGSLRAADLSLTAVVTILQLLAGTIMGIFVLLVHQSFHTGGKGDTRTFLKKTFSWTVGDLLLSSLHGIGSLATNLGFIYGSASLVQILKLVEPFETLILTKLCSAEESKMLSIAIVASMTTVTMSAIALVQQRKAKPHPAAIFFALCSGFALSSRNVAQRRWYAKQAKSAPVQSTNSSLPSVVESVTTRPQNVSTPKSALENGKDETESVSKSISEIPEQSASSVASQQVIKSLTQFTQLSLQSGFMLAFMTFVQLALSGSMVQILTSFTVFPPVPVAINAASPMLHISWQVFLWHPLYNIFSMITLGFCSALTHSLLNAGKRVVAILMAIIWFNEPFSIRTIVTLSVIGLGGSWYVCAVQQKSGGSKLSTATVPYTTAWFLEHRLIQPLLCMVLLTIVYFQPIPTTSIV